MKHHTESYSSTAIPDGLHTFFRHILLSQYDSQFFCTVVTVVEEDNYITFLDSTVEVCINEIGLMNSSVTPSSYDSCIACTMSVAFLPIPFTNKSYASFTCPTFVTVHCIETSNDRSNLSGWFFVNEQSAVQWILYRSSGLYHDRPWSSGWKYFPVRIPLQCHTIWTSVPKKSVHHHWKSIPWSGCFFPCSFAYEKAATTSLFCIMLLSAHARLIFTKSWYTIRPAPMFKWPTSDCPSGRQANLHFHRWPAAVNEDS